VSYAAITANARALLTRKGADATITRKTGEVYNPITQTATSSTSTGTTPAVALPPGKSAEYEVGSLVGRTVLEFWMSTAGALGEVQPGDEITWPGGPWKVFWVQTYDPDGAGPIVTKAYAES